MGAFELVPGPVTGGATNENSGWVRGPAAARSQTQERLQEEEPQGSILNIVPVGGASSASQGPVRSF